MPSPQPIPPPRRALLVRLTALGDVVHCLPAIDALRQLWPTTRFDFLSESAGGALLEGHPDLEHTWVFPRKAWRRRARDYTQWPHVLDELIRFRQQLRDPQYDWVVDFQGNLRSLACQLMARSRHRAGHHPREVKENSGVYPALRPQHPSGRTHRVLKNLHLVRTLGWQGEHTTPRFPDYSAEREVILARSPELESRPLLIHPATSPAGRLKEWPAEHYVALCQRLDDVAIQVSWGPGEEQLARDIADAGGSHVSIAPATHTPRELAALLSFGCLVVGADTGPVHLAAMLGVPVVGLYGPKDPAIYAPWSLKRRLIASKIPCAPCTLRRCSHAICMQLLDPRGVAEACRELLAVTA